MAPSFLFFGALTFADKRAIARALLAIAWAGGQPAGIESVSMLEWLKRMKQTPGAIERFWRVVLVSALDEELARTDARYGIEVFWKAFLGSRGGYRVGIPSVPLGELYEGCRQAIERRGRPRASCARESERFAFATAGSRARYSKTARRFRRMLASSLCRITFFSACCRRKWASRAGRWKACSTFELRRSRAFIFWFDREVMKEPFLTLLDHTTQWVFNKTLLYGQGGRGRPVPATGDQCVL